MRLWRNDKNVHTKAHATSERNLEIENIQEGQTIFWEIMFSSKINVMTRRKTSAGVEEKRNDVCIFSSKINKNDAYHKH